MGGFDWAALPYVVESFGITDPELFMHELAVIRDYLNREK